MSSRNSLQHTVSATEPVGAAIGDEWYNSATNLLYKRMVVAGVAQWASITSASGVVAVSAGGATTQIQFNDSGQFAGNVNLTFDKTTSTLTVPNIVANISEKINKTITNQIGYTVTSTLSAALTLPATVGFKYIIHSIYITNVDAALAATTQVTGSIAYASPVSTVSFANKIPIPARGALELLRKPQVLNPSDVINLQSLTSGTGANSLLAATITYEQVPSAGNYFGVGVSAANVVGDVYTATGAGAVIDSIRLANSSDLGDIAITLTWTDAANAVLSTLTNSFIVPANSTVELCESSKRIPVGNKIRAVATTASAISVFISGRTQ